MLPRRPGEAAASEDVEMNVRDFLPGIASLVENDAISALENPGDTGGFDNGARDFLLQGRDLLEPGEMFTRNDEQVFGRLRMRILEDDDVLGLVNLRRGYFAGCNSAENACFIDRHGTSHYRPLALT